VTKAASHNWEASTINWRAAMIFLFEMKNRKYIVHASSFDDALGKFEVNIYRPSFDDEKGDYDCCEVESDRGHGLISGTVY